MPASAAYSMPQDALVLLAFHWPYAYSWYFNGRSWSPPHRDVQPTPGLGEMVVHDDLHDAWYIRDIGAPAQIRQAGTWATSDAGPLPPRLSPMSTYDADRKCTLVFGGWGGTAFLSDLWCWDGQMWRQLS